MYVGYGVMQIMKQKKNLNTRNKFNSNFPKKGSNKQNKIIYRLRKIFKNKSYFVNPTFQEIANKNKNTYLFSKNVARCHSHINLQKTPLDVTHIFICRKRRWMSATSTRPSRMSR